MLVYKFGGASIQNEERFKNSAQIIIDCKESLLVVVSAMGKTTNALEKVAQEYFAGNTSQAIHLFEEIKQQHLNFANNVLKSADEVQFSLLDFFTEVEWLLHDKPVRNFDYYYDQIVCCGELMSSTILHAYIKEHDEKCAWMDVRDIIKTDNTFRDAAINIPLTQKLMMEFVAPVLSNGKVITQGFIGATDDNETTTLGREGSDYSAAMFANLLNAESLTIWKDVVAVMNADPRKFLDTVAIPQLNYHEVIEMAYYGAQIIHPKTIKPLQNKNIPLYVKSFLDPSLNGTVINDSNLSKLPPVIIQKENQVLLQFQSKDYAFVEGPPAELLRTLFNKYKVNSNISQHTAISLICCFDDNEEKINSLSSEAATTFEVSVHRGLSLLTIRHFTEELIQTLIKGNKIVLEQRTPITVQFVLSPA